MTTVGSLFAGIGGIELGLERAGMKVVWQVEKDPYALAVLEKHWPSVKRYADVREVGARNLAPVDLICGGFPCQDISNAGKRKGIAGERSGLWKEFARIIEEIRPRWTLIENVPALRSRGMEVVLRDLSARGYDAEWDCIPASAFGAPHRRDRLFVVAYSERDYLRDQSGRSGGTSGPDSSVASDDGSQGSLADAEVSRDWHAELAGLRAAGGAGWWGANSIRGSVALNKDLWQIAEDIRAVKA